MDSSADKASNGIIHNSDLLPPAPVFSDSVVFEIMVLRIKN